MALRTTSAVLAAATLLVVLASCGKDDTGAAVPAGGGGVATPTVTVQASASSTAAPTTAGQGSWPALFPDDFPFPPNLTVQETRDEKATALVAGTTPGSGDDFVGFYDEKLPPLGWTYDETTSSGGAHMFSRGPLSVTIVAGQVPAANPDATTFQITLGSSE